METCRKISHGSDSGALIPETAEAGSGNQKKKWRGRWSYIVSIVHKNGEPLTKVTGKTPFTKTVSPEQSGHRSAAKGIDVVTEVFSNKLISKKLQNPSDSAKNVILTLSVAKHWQGASASRIYMEIVRPGSEPRWGARELCGAPPPLSGSLSKGHPSPKHRKEKKNGQANELSSLSELPDNGDQWPPRDAFSTTTPARCRSRFSAQKRKFSRYATPTCGRRDNARRAQDRSFR